MNSIKFTEILGVLCLLFLTGIVYNFQNKITLERSLNEAIVLTQERLGRRLTSGSDLEVIQGNLKSNIVDNFQNSTYTTVVLFEPSGCGSCLDEKSVWSVIQNEYTPVVGVLRHDHSSEIRPYLENASIDIPVLRDTSAQLFAQFSSFSFPLKIVVNARGYILLVDEVRRTKEEQAAFLKVLKYVTQR